MKALIISGGGSKGAFAGGIAEALIKQRGIKYDLFLGSSVGSLLLSHLALNNIDYLKSVFTSISNKDIFSLYPFRVKSVNGKTKISINHFNSIRAFIMGRNTFGESKNLKKLIQKTHTEEHFKQLKLAAPVYITVSNLTLGTVEYKSSKVVTYEDFCEWMWASANYVPFMSMLKKDNYLYADGGFGNDIPIKCAIDKGAKEIDVIILSTLQPVPEQYRFTNPFESLMGVFRFMSNQLSIKDLLISELHSYTEMIDIRVWHIPNKLTDNPLVFDPQLMRQWWEEGYKAGMNVEPVCYCRMPDGEIKKV